MSTPEEELVNLIKHLQVTYNTLNHYTITKKMAVEWMNLEYSKKFIYEKLETSVAQLNRLRAFKSDKTPLHSTIMGGMAAKPPG
jgi:hypothetical protein